jgi:threonine dehydrogenase-like Zn-dependent dehydrogenase
MRQLVVTGTGEVVLRERPSPDLKGKPPGAIVKTTHAMVGVGSTLGPVVERRKAPDPKKEDQEISYQVSGIVTEVTPGLPGFGPGDAVCCPGAGFASNAEEVFIPVHLLGRFKSQKHLEAGSAVNLATTGLHACRRARSTLGEWNAVVGLGMVGQFTVQFAKLFGATVVGSDIVPRRVELARRLGADYAFNAAETDVAVKVLELTGGFGADAVLVAAKSQDPRLFETVDRMVNPDTGRVVLIGMMPIGRPTGRDVELLMCGGCGPGWRDLHYKSEGHDYPKGYVRWSTGRNVQLFADLVSEGRIVVDPLITHRYPVERANDAYTQLIEHPAETLGVVLKF